MLARRLLARDRGFDDWQTALLSATDIQAVYQTVSIRTICFILSCNTRHRSAQNSPTRQAKLVKCASQDPSWTISVCINRRSARTRNIWMSSSPAFAFSASSLCSESCRSHEQRFVASFSSSKSHILFIMSGIPASERNQIYNRKWHHFGLGSEYLHGWYYGGRFVPDSVFATITGADRTVGKLWEKSQPQPDVDKVDLLGRCHWTACTIVLDSWEAVSGLTRVAAVLDLSFVSFGPICRLLIELVILTSTIAYGPIAKQQVPIAQRLL